MDEMNLALHILDVTEDPALAPTGKVHHTKQGTLFDFRVIRREACPPIDAPLTDADAGISRLEH
jgi:hypothetical protein